MQSEESRENIWELVHFRTAESDANIHEEVIFARREIKSESANRNLKTIVMILCFLACFIVLTGVVLHMKMFKFESKFNFKLKFDSAKVNQSSILNAQKKIISTE